MFNNWYIAVVFSGFLEEVDNIFGRAEVRALRTAISLILFLSFVPVCFAWEFDTRSNATGSLCVAMEGIGNNDTEGLFMVQAFSYNDDLVRNINIQLESAESVADFLHDEEYEVKLVFPGNAPIKVTALTDKDATKISFVVLTPNPRILDLLSSESYFTLEIPFLDDFDIRLRGSASAISQWRDCTASLTPTIPVPDDLPAIPTVAEPWGIVAVPPFDGCAVGTLDTGRGIVIRTEANQAGSIQLDAVYDFGPEVLSSMSGGVRATLMVRGPDKDYEVSMVPLNSGKAVLTAYTVPDEFLTHITLASTLLIQVPGLRDLRINLRNTKLAMERWNECLAKLDEAD